MRRFVLAVAVTAVGCGEVKKIPDDFTVGLDQPSLFIRRGETKMVGVTITRTSGTSDLDVTVDGLPNGVTPDSLTVMGDAGTLTLHASASADEGIAMPVVHGSVGDVVADANLRLLVGDAPGTLDLSFGGNGKFVANVPGMVVVGRALTLQNGIIVTGSTTQQQVTVKLKDNGTLDPSFGSNGLVSTGSGDFSEGIAITTLADNRVIVAGIGNGNLSASDTDFGVFAYSPTGVLDQTFGASGVATFNPGTGFAEIHSIAVGTDGSLLASGTLFGSTSTVGVAKRFTATGVVDATYNISETNVSVEASAVQPVDGKLVLAGQMTGQFWLARYNTNGTHDMGFGSGGIVTTSFSPDTASAFGLIPVAGGKFVAAGVTTGANAHIVLARYNANGSPDLSFGVGGKLSTNVGFDTVSPNAALIDASNRLVMVGRVNDVPSVARINADGTPDTSFGTNGIASVDFGIPGSVNNTGGFGIVLDPDGRILFTGEVGPAGSPPNGEHMVVARLWP